MLWKNHPTLISAFPVAKAFLNRQKMKSTALVALETASHDETLFIGLWLDFLILVSVKRDIHRIIGNCESYEARLMPLWPS